MRGSVPAAPSAITQIPGLSRNAVIAASAGTGKTQKLTDIYLVAVLGLGPDGRTVSSERIVATTFSRSAAQEIRERLEVRLGRLCNGEGLGEERLLRELATALEVAPAELRQRANRALEQLPLSTIDTLHGLALNLVRSFALDLGFPPSLVVLEEEEALADTAATVDSVFTSALEEGGEPALAAVRLIDACVGLENARFEVATLIERLNDEAILPADLATGLHVKARDELIGDLCAQDQTSEVPGLKSLLQALLHGKRPALSDLSEALARFLAALSSRRRRDDASLQTLLRSAGGNTAAERLHALSEFLLRAEDLDQEVSRVIQLISEVQRRLSASRAARGVASFGDLLRIARKGLRDHPELALAAALRIDLLLVDEFQDTNGAQRDFLLLLRERPESIRLRRPGDLPTVNDISERGLVVVGDRKQSIYGFRGADVAVFARFAAELAGEAAAEALALRGVRVTSEPRAAFHSLRQNHRCALAILDAVNRIAQHDFEAEPVHAFEIRYMPAELLAPPEEAGTELGRVTLIEDDGTVPANASALALGARGALRSALLAGSFCERARWEGFGWRDIAVLARRRATLALVELALEERKIPFVVSGRALYATVEVRDLFSALRLAVDPLDRRALSVVARGTLGGLSDSTLAELSREDHGLRTPDQWRQVEIRDEAERAAVAELGSRLEVWIRTAPRLSPRDAIQFALECFQLESVFSGLTRPEARLGNVGRLLEIAAHHGGSLPSFVRWLGRQIALDADESEAAVFSEEDDAVRLL
ncbi:MAG TPA: UvrD-helicase domain-containing protein, partial [Polyangiaceae bacterium]